MEIVIRKNQKKYEDIIYNSIWVAKDFLHERFPDVDFSNVNFIFGGGTRCRYYRKWDWNGEPLVYINMSAKWYTYKMKRLKVHADGIFVGIENHTILGLIHELTHHIQYELGLPKGESLTTKHELEYCREKIPQYEKQLKII